VLLSAIYSSVFILFLILLFSKKILRNELWRATIIPLASIIGSGFLIAAPLLNNLSGDKAPYLMFGLCALSFMNFQVKKLVRRMLM